MIRRKSVEELIARGIPPKDAVLMFKRGVGKGIHKAHKPKKRPYVKYEDRSNGEFFY